MASADGWKVDCSAVVAENLRQVQREANQQGVGKQALEAIHQILERLQKNPVGFGEALYSCPP